MEEADRPRIGLALSGGGSRAIAFHLGCMRALHKRKLLPKIVQLSSVSGGAIIAAMYAYMDQPFSQFDKSVVQQLSKGLRGSIVAELFSPSLALKIAMTNLVSRPVSLIAALFGRTPPFRRWASRTDAFEAALRRVLSDKTIENVERSNLGVIFNACDLRTSSAFRFGNRISGSWRYGAIADNRVAVAHAVACSAAYPIAFPAFDRYYQFVKGGSVRVERVILTDGGVYDNLGLSCLEPDRDSRFSLHTPVVNYIICCYAGTGQPTGKGIPFGFVSRTEAAFGTVFKKNQDWGLRRLHSLKQSGLIRGFALPYLGQLDYNLPSTISDLVTREQVIGYPTDFSPMTEADVSLISLRGEQLTGNLLDHYLPDL